VAQRGGLGRGLGALIPTGGAPAGPTGLEELPLASIRPNQYQPRDRFDEEALVSLSESIRELGVLQPVLVRPSDDGTGYELIAGERRWRAARRAGLQTIPAIIRTVDDVLSLEQALVENLHRTDLGPLEEATAYQQLAEEFQLTHEQIAQRVGRSRATVSNTLRLLQLPASIQRLVQDGQIQMGHARALLATPDRSYQEHLAQRVVREGLSVRDVEEAVRARSGLDDDDGGGASSSPRVSAPSAATRPAGLLELEELLSEHLETRVQVSLSTRRGKILIEFADLDDLERIYRRMSSGEHAPA
jgi:ParB family transcriptional regulator, chromosome partitioning protein